MFGKSTVIRFTLSKTLSLLGNSIAGVVFPLILLATTGDALAAGTLALVCAIPQVLAGVLGGVLLDRFNRRKMSALSDLISAFSVAMLPLIDMAVGLSFGWFALFGILGAIGDVPGMTARDTLLPSVAEHDKINLQSFMGLSQSIDSLTIIIGPALAALLVGFLGGASSLWVTASLSFLAAMVTLTLPRSIGTITAPHTPDDAIQKKTGVVRVTAQSLREGYAFLFKSSGIITTAVLFSFGIVMVLGSYQGLVLPVYFTDLQQPELLGYVLSALSSGMLIGSLLYAALATHLEKRTWYVLSLVGIAGGIIVLGLLPPYPVMLLGAFVLGAFSGPVSALLGFFVLERIPEEKRGVVLGTENSLLLVAAPAAIFCSSVLVSSMGTNIASLVLVGLWLLITAWALASKGMRNLDEDVDRSGKSLVDL